jgi:hypothetical protein
MIAGPNWPRAATSYRNPARCANRRAAPHVLVGTTSWVRRFARWVRRATKRGFCFRHHRNKGIQMRHLVHEGRQPVTSVDGAWCGARGCGFVGHAPGEPRDPALRALRPVREELAEGPAPRWRRYAKTPPKRAPGTSATLTRVRCAVRRPRSCQSERGLSGMPCVFRPHHSPHRFHLRQGAPAHFKQQGRPSASAWSAGAPVSARRAFRFRSARRNTGRSVASMSRQRPWRRQDRRHRRMARRRTMSSPSPPLVRSVSRRP